MRRADGDATAPGRELTMTTAKRLQRHFGISALAEDGDRASVVSVILNNLAASLQTTSSDDDWRVLLLMECSMATLENQLQEAGCLKRTAGAPREARRYAPFRASMSRERPALEMPDAA
jgi:hypothetical protein